MIDSKNNPSAAERERGWDQKAVIAACFERHGKCTYRMEGFLDGARWQYARDQAALAESASRVRGLEAEISVLREALDWYDKVHRYHWAIDLNQLEVTAFAALTKADAIRSGRGDE